MAEDNMNVVQCAQRPVIPEGSRELVLMVDAEESMSEIYKKLVKGPLVQCIDNQAWFRDEPRMMEELFHSMSRQLLRCLLLNNLGPDLYDREGISRRNWKDHVYHGDGPGAYILFSHVRGRQGKWLCKKEVEQLIDLLKIYKAAIMVYERRREMDREVGQLDGDQKDALKMAMKIDTVAEWAPPCWPPSEEELEKYRPCFMSSSKGAEHVEEMVKVLGRRCLPGVDETVYQCQSPIMVGSSGNMSRRTAAHLPNTLMSHTPKAWALMLSCMRVMGINYEVQSAPLFRAWQNEKQVKAAEVLGAVLAGSMVSVAGLNVEQPGLQHSDLKLSQEVFKEGERQVCAMKPWYRENLKLSISRKPENREITDHLERNREELRKLQEREDRGRKDLEKANSENEAAKAPLNSLMTKIRGKLEHGERVLDELKRERDSNRELATGEEAILGEENESEET